MDAHHFDDYAAFPFDGLPDDDNMLALSNQQSLNLEQSIPDAYASAAAMANAPGPSFPRGAASISSVNIGYDVAASQRTSSVDRQDDDVITIATNEKRTPASGTVDDSNVGDDISTPNRGRADGTDLGGRPKDDRSEHMPSWSDLKTKAGKERKRLPLACIACRRKKIRCSGEKPACKHCLRSRVPCVYKVTARKAAPRTDYMAMLDKRLKRMEERIIKVIPKAEQGATANVPRAVLKPSIPGTNPASKPANRKRNAGEAFGGVEAFLKASSNNEQVETEKANAQRIKEAEETHLFQEGADALPSKEVQEHLAEIFFDNVYGQAYNLLHKPSYMRKLKNNQLPPVLVLSVCAIAARFAGNPKFHSDDRKFLEGEEWASHARAICVRRYEWPNITILTCLLILGLHEFGTCHGGRSWALGGQAIRMAFALQLHKELDHDPSMPGSKTPLSFIDREIRRRIMWACFLMDRFNSSGTDRPMFIREETIQICLPVSERCFQLDMPVPTETLDGKVHPLNVAKEGQHPDLRNNMGVAAYLIRSVALWARIITYLNQGGRDADAFALWDEKSGYAALCKDAEGFQGKMPQILRFTTENLALHDTENTAKQYLLMHITIQQNILFLNRAASMTQGQDGKTPPESFVSETVAKTFDAARRISFLLEEAEKTSQFVSAPFAGYCAFTATIVHVMGIRLGNPLAATNTNPNVEVNIRYLNKMVKHWGMFYWMVEHVRKEYRAALDAARAGKIGKDKGVSLLQYGDWFNEYPHGLADSDIMDPANSKKKEKGADGVLEPKSELQSVEEFFTTLSPHNQEKPDGQKGQGPSKRKQAARKQSAATIRINSGKPLATNTETNSQQVASQISAQLQQQQQQQHQQQLQQQQHQKQQQQQQEQQRRYGGQHHNQANGPAGYNGISPAAAQSGAFTASPISPVAMQNQFAQQPGHGPGPGPGRTGFFTSEMIMPQQPNPLLQSMEPQMMLDGFSLEANGAMGAHGMMDGNHEWNAMQMAALHQHRNMKRETSNAIGQGQNGNNRDMMGFNPQDTSWFMPFNMEPPGPSADVNMDASNLDAFNGLFNGSGNGMTTPNPLGGLQQGQ